jgi:hypothetical protein
MTPAIFFRISSGRCQPDDRATATILTAIRRETTITNQPVKNNPPWSIICLFAFSINFAICLFEKSTGTFIMAVQQFASEVQ